MAAVRCLSNKVYRHARGFSLISLIIGLGLGLLVVELSMQWLGISRKQWDATGNSLAADRNNRTLFLSLKQDLNACGYRGFHLVETKNKKAVQSKSFSEAHQIFNAKWRSRLLPDSNILEIADIPVAHCVIEKQTADFLQIKKNGNKACRVNAGVRALIADAKGAVWLHVKRVNNLGKAGQQIVPETKMHRIYGNGAIFTPVEQVIYFVARSSRDPKKGYALWRRVKDQESEELLQGITAFKALVTDCEWGTCVRVTWTDDRLLKPLSVEIAVGHVNG